MIRAEDLIESGDALDMDALLRWVAAELVSPAQQTGMVTGYRLGDEFMKGEIGPRRCFESKHSPCGRMVH